MPRGVTFHPVGWEDTLSGVGRAQGLINKDLKQCDYAVFVWHDRWGSPTGKRKMVGTEEERKLAESSTNSVRSRGSRRSSRMSLRNNCGTQASN
jgi:hypothetical protein